MQQKDLPTVRVCNQRKMLHTNFCLWVKANRTDWVKNIITEDDMVTFLTGIISELKSVAQDCTRVHCARICADRWASEERWSWNRGCGMDNHRRLRHGMFDQYLSPQHAPRAARGNAAWFYIESHEWCRSKTNKQINSDTHSKVQNKVWNDSFSSRHWTICRQMAFSCVLSTLWMRLF